MCMKTYAWKSHAELAAKRLQLCMDFIAGEMSLLLCYCLDVLSKLKSLGGKTEMLISLQWRARLIYRVAQQIGSLVCIRHISVWNIDKFSNFISLGNQNKICNNTITKDPTTPQMCRYTTLWNVSVLLKQQLKTKLQ